MVQANWISEQNPPKMPFKTVVLSSGDLLTSFSAFTTCRKISNQERWSSYDSRSYSNQIQHPVDHRN
jgi:hypothetical protein